MQVQRQLVSGIKRGGHRAFHDCAIGDAPYAGDIDGDTRAVTAFNTKPADDEFTLGDGVYLAIGAFQRRHQQAAAAQAFCIAQ